jgi:hypothetical protein
MRPAMALTTQPGTDTEVPSMADLRQRGFHVIGHAEACERGTRRTAKIARHPVSGAALNVQGGRPQPC